MKVVTLGSVNTHEVCILQNLDTMYTQAHTKGTTLHSDCIATHPGAIWSLSETLEYFPSPCRSKPNKLFSYILTLWHKPGSWKR